MGYQDSAKCPKCGMMGEYVLEDGSELFDCPICGHYIHRYSRAWGGYSPNEKFDIDDCQRSAGGGSGVYAVCSGHQINRKKLGETGLSIDKDLITYDITLYPGAEAVYDVTDFANIKPRALLTIDMSKFEGSHLSYNYDICEDAVGGIWLVSKYTSSFMPIKDNILAIPPVYLKGVEILKKKYSRWWDEYIHEGRFECELHEVIDKFVHTDEGRRFLEYNRFPTTVTINFGRDMWAPHPDSIKGRFYDRRYAKLPIDIEYIGDARPDFRVAEFAQMTVDDLIVSDGTLGCNDFDPPAVNEVEDDVKVDFASIFCFPSEEHVGPVFHQVTIDELLTAGDEIEE